jgi:hypothetical protein
MYVGFQETNKESFSNTFLKKILGNRNFTWNLLPSVGSAGGILVGVDADVLEVISWEVKCFSVGVIVKNRCNDCIFRIVTVYGPPYHSFKNQTGSMVRPEQT